MLHHRGLDKASATMNTLAVVNRKLAMTKQVLRRQFA